MNFDSRLKRITIDINLDVILHSLKCAPDRCFRNLTELCTKLSGSDGSLTQGKRENLQELLKERDPAKIRQWFYDTFLGEH